MDRHIETPIEGIQLLQDFLMDRTAKTPDDVHEKLRQLTARETNNIYGSVQAAELIYARRDELPASLLEIGAQLATMCGEYNFHGLGAEGRGKAMAATIRKMPEVASKAPKSTTKAPEPKAEFLPEPPAPEVPTPAGGD